MTINIHDAKTNFSQLIRRALSGEEIVIAKNGKPLIRLEPIGVSKTKRTPGLSRGDAMYTDDFTAPLSEDIIEEFEK